MSRTWKKICVFYGLTLLFSVFFYASIITSGFSAGDLYFVQGLMWCPGVSAILTKTIFRESVTELGWRWGRNRYQLMGYVIPLCYVIPVYVIVWVTGLGGVPSATFIQDKAKAFGWEVASTGTFLAGYIALTATVGLVKHTGSLGEEIGWRGFLVPELAKVVGFKWSQLSAV